MKQIMLALLAVVGPLAGAFAEENRVPIYIFTKTDPSGFVDADSIARLEAVRVAKYDLRKSKLVVVVEERDAATMLVEVTGTSQEETTNSLAMLSNALNQAAGGLNALRPRADEKDTITLRHATLTVGTYTTELKARLKVKGAQLSQSIEQWVTTNRVQLKARQPQ